MIVQAAQRTSGSKAPASVGSYDLVVVPGPGVFVAAQVTKRGGVNDNTVVLLDIDSNDVFAISYAAARNSGLTTMNPFGIVLRSTTQLDNLTFGFPSPLHFTNKVVLTAIVNETGVLQLAADVIHGT
jgi:hypothetical protein